MKKLILLAVALVMGTSVHAQLHGNKWRLGFSAGTTNYIGDIRPLQTGGLDGLGNLYRRYDRYAEKLSYQASLEYALGNSVGLMLSAGSYQFGSADRLVQNDGTLYRNGPDFDRALNFQTDLRDAGLSLVFKPDNNWLLSGKSFIAPYFTLGLGVQTFEVWGDLLDADGNRYDYTNPNLIPDGNFETALTALNTERDSPYNTTTLYANLGLGIRFRITNSFELFAQSDFKRAATDYLDDVSGQYRAGYDSDFQAYAAKPGPLVVPVDDPQRGMGDGRPDWYIYHGIGIKFSFGANKEAFNPPVVTQRYTYEPVGAAPAAWVPKDSIPEPAVPRVTNTTNYFTLIQLPTMQGQASGSPAASGDVARINQQLDSLQQQRDSLLLRLEGEEVLLDSLVRELDRVGGDSLLPQQEREAQVSALEEQRGIAEERIAGITTQLDENQQQMDALIREKMRLVAVHPGSGMDSTAVTDGLRMLPYEVRGFLSRFDSAYPVYRDMPVAATAGADSSQAAAPPYGYTTRSDDAFTRADLELELGKLRQELRQQQPYRQPEAQYNYPGPVYSGRYQPDSRQEPIYYSSPAPAPGRRSGGLFGGLFGGSRREERRNERNNALLRDALIMGGTAAAVSAAASPGRRQEPAAAAPEVEGTVTVPVPVQEYTATSDSAYSARIARDALLIDSLRNLPAKIDTVVVDKEVPVLLSESKVEVLFGINETAVSRQEKQKLERIASILEKNQTYQVELIGYADNTGSVRYNLQLVQQRVAAVARVLSEAFGISPGRIQRNSGGMIVRGNDRGSVEADRKVEIRLIPR